MHIPQKPDVIKIMINNIYNFLYYIGEQMYETKFLCPLEDIMCSE